MIGLQKFLFLFISKYRRKPDPTFPVSYLKDFSRTGKSRLTFVSVLYYLLAIGLLVKVDEVHSLECGVVRTQNASGNSSNITAVAYVSEPVSNCINGDCINGICACRKGWYGPSCQYCYGKVRYELNF